MMPLRQTKRFKRLELPEFVTLVLVGSATVVATFWWQANVQPRYRQVVGRILSCDIRLTHYNATGDLNKVSLTYEYTVGPATYTGSWAGSWPHAQSPNALPANEIDMLKTKDRPITVLFSPDNPGNSLLHYPDQGASRIYGVIALCTLFAAILYCCTIYPAWRSRW